VATIQTTQTDNRFLLRNVSWQFYEAALEQVADEHVLLTYDRGALEFMSPSAEHEWYKHLLSWFILILCQELHQPVRGGGSMTVRREDLDRGLEPDECYWFAHEASVRSKREIDLSVDPPPDLAIEIDITRSHLDRQAIYAALRVPEVWCFNGETLRVFALGADGHYAVSRSSKCFPALPIERFAAFLQQDTPQGEMERLEEFRVWVQREIALRARGDAAT
jgi:Uma2 family endonuclease